MRAVAILLVLMPLSAAAQVAVCGNAQVEAGEACDDGNDDNRDDCLDDCTDARCGDGFVRQCNPARESCGDPLCGPGDYCLRFDLRVDEAPERDDGYDFEALQGQRVQIGAAAPLLETRIAPTSVTFALSPLTVRSDVENEAVQLVATLLEGLSTQVQVVKNRGGPWVDHLSFQTNTINGWATFLIFTGTASVVGQLPPEPVVLAPLALGDIDFLIHQAWNEDGDFLTADLLVGRASTRLLRNGDFAEACDDGNLAAGDGCSPECELEADPADLGVEDAARDSAPEDAGVADSTVDSGVADSSMADSGTADSSTADARADVAAAEPDGASTPDAGFDARPSDLGWDVIEADARPQASDAEADAPRHAGASAGGDQAESDGCASVDPSGAVWLVLLLGLPLGSRRRALARHEVSETLRENCRQRHRSH